MQLTIRLLGTEVLHISTEAAVATEDEEWQGDVTTQPIGYAPSPGPQRWNEHETPEG